MVSLVIAAAVGAFVFKAMEVWVFPHVFRGHRGYL